MTETRTRFDRCLITLKKKKNNDNLVEKKIHCSRFYYISIGVRAVLRFLVSIKNLEQYKKLPYNKFGKKKHLLICKMF